ncbi:hypothetical protein A8924_2252 [Saccharopolyspora erythraea NRRL 2338]|uniref:Uncharacterized protein n=2 Tax=Saccharopolyspora erythraea TaxID=1836 RepID=A4FAU0_SACEN|nr:hypothetical protein [Saccharopolyspora erythraea]EQD81895.1 hypothetical protein N599_33640 [Saccharopolyspora erythraea D]PFG94947.1 hypothetical protein A8924_2252 [Saccharopolyspora erythraea NRRL 2338]QRK91641.1 hypothetical protein JQX30_09815 [Saccharopolyspora erythraea]CAM01165.1 hypothetical protein SACE_1853 [Saccharopolyspora erythraea NRRL 2338]
MSQPGIEAELEALRSDAGVWKTAAEDLRGVLEATRSLSVTAADVSMWASDRGMDGTLNAARDALADMLDQAAEYFREIGDDLLAAADQYEHDDALGKHGIQAVHGQLGER